MSDDVIITGWAKLGGILRDARSARGLTQAEVAERAGVARSWLARVEAGHRGAALEPLLRLLSVLDLSLSLKSNDTGDKSTVTDSPTGDRANPVGRSDRLSTIASSRRDSWARTPRRGARARDSSGTSSTS